VVAAGAAAAGRPLVADEPATAFGEDRRAAGQARPVLLALAGGGSLDAVAFRGAGAADRGVARTRRIPKLERRQTRGTAAQPADRSLKTGLGQRQFSVPEALASGGMDPCGQSGSNPASKAVLRR